MIAVLTGPVGSGKTTRLGEWVKRDETAAGILMPVLNGERHLYSIGSGELVPVEIREDSFNDEVIRIGKFSFSKQVFDWGNREILKGCEENKLVVIDEIGPLEMNGKGFYSSLHQILENRERRSELNLILVVREGMVEQVTGFFAIKEYTVFSSVEEIRSLLTG